MSAAVEIDVSGYPQVKAMFDSMSGRELENRLKRATRAGATVMRQEMRSEARARGDLPKTFAQTRTRAHQNPIGVSVSPKSPLSNIFEHGAGGHEIAPGLVHYTGRGRHRTALEVKPVLAGKAGDRDRAEDFFSAHPVHHPGMAARPFIGPVFEAAEQRAGTAVEEKLFEGIE